MNSFGVQARLIEAASGRSWSGPGLEAYVHAMENELRTMPAGLLLLPRPGPSTPYAAISPHSANTGRSRCSIHKSISARSRS